MGYRTNYGGTLKLTPAVEDEHCLAKEMEDLADGLVWDEGITIHESGAEAWIYGESRYEEDVRRYVEHIVALMKAKGIVVEGEIYGEGSESEDFWRYLISADGLVYQEGRVVYG